MWVGSSEPRSERLASGRAGEWVGGRSGERANERVGERVRTLAFVSFKGGAGKTTAAMAVASALVAAGRSVAVVDADENAPLIAWRDRAVAADLWVDACTVGRGDDTRALEAELTRAEDAGRDVAIIDTRGGGSELNDAIIGNADAIVVPTALTGLDIASALETFEYVIRLHAEMGVHVPVALLVQRVPVGRLTVSQSQDLEALSTLPRCEPVLHARDAFGAISKRGLLHLLHARAEADVRARLTANHLRVAMAEADALRVDLETKLGEASV